MIVYHVTKPSWNRVEYVCGIKNDFAVNIDCSSENKELKWEGMVLNVFFTFNELFHPWRKLNCVSWLCKTVFQKWGHFVLQILSK